jgi:hypothetical protein
MAEGCCFPDWNDDDARLAMELGAVLRGIAAGHNSPVASIASAPRQSAARWLTRRLFANLGRLLVPERLGAVGAAVLPAGLLANNQALLVRAAPCIGDGCGRRSGHAEKQNDGSGNP